MVALIERLVERGHAYAADGHVLFSVPSMPDYGRLSRKPRDELIAGARVEVAPYKKDPADFVLWKPSTDAQAGWPSPWGRGRPGWHIECSAMSAAHLGETFDIHAGGLDLIFPHHENEIAQSRSAFGHAIMAKYWMHNGFLNISGEKMSKSLGNFFTVHELLDQYPGEAIRLLLLSAHYRQPLDFTHEGLQASKATLDRWYGFLRGKTIAEAAVPRSVEDALSGRSQHAAGHRRDPSARRSGAAPRRRAGARPAAAGRRGMVPLDSGGIERTRRMPRSRRRSPPARRRARRRTSRSPTASATSSRPRA